MKILNNLKKNSGKLVLFSIYMFTSHLIFSMRNGSFRVTKEIRTGRFSSKMIGYAEECQNYTNGGLTFTYPASFFTNTPVISATIEGNANTESGALYTTCVMANSTTETTIIVNKATDAGISEAADNEVCVHLIAIEE